MVDIKISISGILYPPFNIIQYQIDDIESGILLVKSMNDEKQGNLTIPGHRNHGYFIYISPASS